MLTLLLTSVLKNSSEGITVGNSAQVMFNKRAYIYMNLNVICSSIVSHWCVLQVFMLLKYLQSNLNYPNPFGQLKKSKGSDKQKVRITEIPPMTTPKLHLPSFSIILSIDRTTCLCFLLLLALELASVAIVHEWQPRGSVHHTCANRPLLLILVL